MFKNFPRFFRHIGNAIKFNQLPQDQRRIVFYSEGKNYWGYLEKMIKEFLRLSEIPVCFVTSSLDDPGLQINHPNYLTFIIDEGYVRDWFFANVDTEVMVMTMPDLHQYQVKKSKNEVHYVYTQHSLVSFHMVYRKGAFDYFDTIFCSGPHHLVEMRALVDKYHLSPKTLVEHGYSRIDAIIEEAKNRPDQVKPAELPKHILVAPSWGPKGIIESGIGEKIVGYLLKNGYQVTLRPHPQTIKFAKDKINAIVSEYERNTLFASEDNVGGQESIQNSDLMICDWSGVAYDYAFGMEKPVLFIDMPRKINNPDYEELGIEPFEVSIRKSVGDVVSVDDLDSLSTRIETIFRDLQSGGLSFAELREANVYNVGRSGIVGAEHLIALLQNNL